MVSPKDSRRCRFTVHYTASVSVLPRVLDILARFGLEPAWLFTRIKPSGAFRLDVRLAEVCEQRAAIIAARIAGLVGVTKVDYALKEDQEFPETRRV